MPKLFFQEQEKEVPQIFPLNKPQHFYLGKRGASQTHLLSPLPQGWKEEETELAVSYVWKGAPFHSCSIPIRFSGAAQIAHGGGTNFIVL